MRATAAVTWPSPESLAPAASAAPSERLPPRRYRESTRVPAMRRISLAIKRLRIDPARFAADDVSLAAERSTNRVSRIRAALAKLLMSRLLVTLIEPLTRDRIRHLGATIRPDPTLIAPHTRAELFWGLFERTECRFIRRYLKGSDCVIELGGGIGATSTHIVSVLARGATFVSVEANPAFVPMIERNIAPRVRRSHLHATVRNVAIGCHDRASVLMVSANPFSSRVGVAGDGSVVAHVPVPAQSLPSLIAEHGLESFDLVCDIEGAEGAFLVHPGRSGLEGCGRLIIELHRCALNGAIYSPDDLLAILRTKWGFSLLERKGSVAALARNRPSYLGGM